MKAGESEEKTVCKSCRKPVDAEHYDSHLTVCTENKKELARRKKERKEAKVREVAAAAKVKDEDGDTVMGNSKTGDDADTDKGSVNGDAISGNKKPPKKSSMAAPAKKTTATTNNKKRKAEEAGSSAAGEASASNADTKEPKKKKQKKDAGSKDIDTPNAKSSQADQNDTKATTGSTAKGSKPNKMAKPKGPVNVEVQCGVPLEKEGKVGFCARSLTCKSHSMGLKRAVPGRSMPYDQLLAQYQRRNNAKQQKAMMEAHAAAAKKAGGRGGAGGLYDDDDDDIYGTGAGGGAGGGGQIDSEEERENVMKALSHWRPRPLEQVTTVPIGKRYRYVRLKEMLGNALSGSVAGSEKSTAPAAGSSFPNAITAQKSSLFAVPTACDAFADGDLDMLSAVSADPSRHTSAIGLGMTAGTVGGSSDGVTADEKGAKNGLGTPTARKTSLPAAA